MWRAFIFLITLQVRVLRAACKSRDELVLENLALRQQVTALKLGRHRPKLHDADRAFWVALRKSWSNWAARLVIVKPETVACITVTCGKKRRKTAATQCPFDSVEARAIPLRMRETVASGPFSSLKVP